MTRNLLFKTAHTVDYKIGFWIISRQGKELSKRFYMNRGKTALSSCRRAGETQQKACSSGGPSAASLGTASFMVQTRAVPLESNISLSFPCVAEKNLSPAWKKARLGLLLCQQAPCAPTAPHSPHTCPVQKHQHSSLAKSTLCRFMLRQCVLIRPIKTGIQPENCSQQLSLDQVHSSDRKFP